MLLLDQVVNAAEQGSVELMRLAKVERQWLAGRRVRRRIGLAQQPRAARRSIALPRCLIEPTTQRRHTRCQSSSAVAETNPTHRGLGQYPGKRLLGSRFPFGRVQYEDQGLVLAQDGLRLGRAQRLSTREGRILWELLRQAGLDLAAALLDRCQAGA